MFFNKLKWAALAAVATGFVFTSAAVLGRQAAEKKAELPPGDQKSVDPTDNASTPREAFKVFPYKPASNSEPPAKVFTEVMEKKPAPVEEGAQGRGKDPRSRQILEKLEEPISMPFANETPIDDVLKYIKQSTTTKTFSGIPIYVDPMGLQEAERSLNSTIQMELENVPLRRTLQLLLEQLGLAYFVEDGFLIITSKDSASQRTLSPSMASPPPIFERLEKAKRGELDVDQMKELLELLKLRAEVKRAADNYVKGSDQAKAHPDQTAELIKEVRELIQLLKAEKQGSKPVEKK